jgi:hypothetical protein
MRANVESGRALLGIGPAKRRNRMRPLALKRLALLFGICVLVSVAAVTASVVPASAAATVIRGTTESQIADTGLMDDCRPGITGDLSGTEVIDFQSVETAEGFHVVGTTTDTGRIDWSDGSYTIIESVDHFAVNSGRQTMVFTLAHQDSGDTYSTSGAFLYRLTFHSVERVTVTGGVPHAEFERGHVHVFGNC